MKDVIHEDLVQKGYIVSHACRYGGDFVIYEAHPSVCHSSDTIRVIEPDEAPPAIDVAGFCRVQGSVLKRGVFATVLKSGKPAYVGIQYNPALSTDPVKKLERRLSRAIVESPRRQAAAAARGDAPDLDDQMDLDDDLGPDEEAFDAPHPDRDHVITGIDDDDDL